MAAESGLPPQSARPSDVPSNVGGTALGFICSRDMQAGEVLPCKRQADCHACKVLQWPMPLMLSAIWTGVP